MKILPHLHCSPSLILVLIAFASCKVSENDAVVVTAPPEYSIDLFEQREPANGTPTFGLWVESVEKYKCPGYGIDAQTDIQSGSITITLLGVLEPALCVGDSAPAKQFLPIGNLTDGTYEFNISLRNVIVNKGALTVTSGHFVLSMPNAQGIVIDNFILELLPKGIVWGYARTPSESSQPVADNFLSDLKTLTTENGLAPGFYSYFTVSGTDNISFHRSIAPDGAAKHFVRRLAASPDALKDLLQNYRNAAQQPLNIKCWTTEGEL